MKMTSPLLFAVLVSLQCGIMATANATGTADARARLEMALSCHGSAQPQELATWISDLGGGPIVDSSRIESGAEYTIPNPIYVLGFPATRFNVRAFHGQGRDFSVYETIFPDTAFSSIASIAKLSPDQAGNYQRRVGDNHLFLRQQADVAYVTCAAGIHGPGLERALHAPDDDAPAVNMDNPNAVSR